MLYSDCRFQITVVVQLWPVDHDNSAKDRDTLNKFPFQSRKFKNVINKKIPMSETEQLESCVCQEDVDASDRSCVISLENGTKKRIEKFTSRVTG